MLASVTHELKTPLNTICVTTEQMFKDIEDERLKRNLKRIKTSSTLMLSLVNDIIDNAKLDEGGL